MSAAFLRVVIVVSCETGFLPIPRCAEQEGFPAATQQSTARSAEQCPAARNAFEYHHAGGSAMRVYDVAGKVDGSGEYVLGAEATGSHACYLIYGVLKAGERGRVLKPGRSHEEMVLCISGEMRMSGGWSRTLKQGQAVHLRGEESCTAENLSQSDAIYVIAGGHADGGHHH
jgi:hypothetical protein